ncbi:hypothetical protein D3C87_422740 [compost metagenome]
MLIYKLAEFTDKRIKKAVLGISKTALNILYAESLYFFHLLFHHFYLILKHVLFVKSFGFV